RERRRAHGRLDGPRGLGAHPRRRLRHLLQPLARAAVAQGRDQRQRDAGARGAPRLRPRHRAPDRGSRRPRLPHRRADLLLRGGVARPAARRTAAVITPTAREGGYLPIAAYGLIGAGPAEPRVVRILECLSGEMTVRHECLPAPGYAEPGPAVPGFDGGVLRAGSGDDDVLVTGTEPIVRSREELHLLAGESVAFGL